MRPYTSFKAHPEDLRWGLQASSILDVLLCSNPAIRYHWFYPGRHAHLDVGHLDHGSGDELFILFDDNNGCLIKGFDHESPMSPHATERYETWPGVFEDVPPELAAHLDNEELRKVETTFCIWRRKADNGWSQGDIAEHEGGEWSEMLLNRLFTDAESYLDWATTYYGRALPKEVVTAVFDSLEIDEVTAFALNPKIRIDLVRPELNQMGISFQNGSGERGSVSPL